MDAEVEAAKSLVGVEEQFVRKVVFVWPVGGVGVPVDGESRLADIEGVEDELCAAEMMRRADDLGG